MSPHAGFRFHRALIAILIPLASLSSCAKEEETAAKPGNFRAPFENMRYDLKVLDTNGGVNPIRMEAAGGKQSLGGRELTVMTLSNSNTGQPLGMEVAGEINGDEIVLGTVQLDRVLTGIDIELVPSAPVEIDLGAPLGEPQTLVVDGNLSLGDPLIPVNQYMPFEVTYTVTAHGVTASTPMGAVPDCTLVSFSGEKSGLSATGQVWVKEGVGFVHAEVDTVPWGHLYAGVGGYFGFVDDGTTATIQAEGIVGPGNPNFRLSTYDLNGAYDADKMTHAQMYLEARWADDARAKTAEAVPISHLFSTAWGYFFSSLVQSPTGFLHEGEWGQGYNYWVAFADEAAKNEPGPNGIIYNAEATYQLSTVNQSGDVHVGAFIHYTLYKP